MRKQKKRRTNVRLLSLINLNSIRIKYQHSFQQTMLSSQILL